MTNMSSASRRLFLLLLFLTLGILKASTAISNADDVPRLSKAQIEGAQGCWLAAGLGNSANRPNLLTYSGNQELDAASQREGLELIRKFGVSPRGFFFNDEGAPNAYATNRAENSAGPDGTVVLGLTLVNAELRRDGGAGLAVPAIMAHEFAHIVQYKRNSPLSTKLKELQADYLAGWYLGNRFIYTNVGPAFQAFFGMGDYKFNDPNHHGTPAQRLSAIKAGLEESKQSFDQAYGRSSEYVKSL
jgi:hypothetical protein